MLITLELIKSCSVHTKQRKQETLLEFLRRLTHLHLNGKHITKLSAFEECINLEVLYLYDNEIKIIENLDSLSKLTHLYLQDNQISKISNLENFCLQKLSLDRNCISVVEGLHNQYKLEELYISSQHPNIPNQQLSFDERSLNSLSGHLTVLHCASNYISNLHDISLLSSLTLLDLSHNNVSDLQELQTLLKGCVRLKKLMLKGNPVCKKREYKDFVIASSSPALQMLDEKEITSNERIFLEKKASMRKTTPPSQPASSTATPFSHPSFSTSNIPASSSPTPSRRNSTSSSVKRSDSKSSIQSGAAFGGT